MARIQWGEGGTRLFETGVDRVVLFPHSGGGVPWNGVRSIKEAPTGSEVTPTYIDGHKYFRNRVVESFAFQLEAFTYPHEFSEYDGYQSNFFGQQRRREFGLAYRTLVGDDISGTNAGYKLHLVYNCLADPSSRNADTLKDQVDSSNFVWDVTTRPVMVPDTKGTAHLIIDSRIAHEWTLEALENEIYGSPEKEPRLPSPEEIIEIFEENAILRIIDHGDGTWTAIGPDSAINMISPTEFEITWPSAVYIDEESYIISSL